MSNSLSYRKTKIVATIGPASSDYETLKKLIQAGMNVARLNFSHGTFKEHEQTVMNIRRASEDLVAPVGILQDLQGPKIRILGFEGEKQLNPGDKIIITDSSVPSKSENHFQVDIEDLHKFVKKEQSIFIDDGIIEIKIEKVDGKSICCEVIHGGTLRPRKGVNLPDIELPIESMTAKDIKDLKMGAALGFDYVALSFVRSSEDIVKLKKRLKKLGSTSRVIAKIEKKEALLNIESILEEVDGIMVARGDLSVEIGQVHLPAEQKKLIKLCNKKGKPVITATQMLESMHINSRPTRAEITDVANAVLDGSDALMLSGESAFGKYPVRSVQTMHDIVLEVEKQPSLYHRFKNQKKSPTVFTVPESIAISAVLCSRQLESKTIVCLSTTGKTAQMISKYRPKAKLIAVTGKNEALCKLELCWGVQTLKIQAYKNTEDAVEKIEHLLLENGVIKEGDNVVLTLGLPVAMGQKTNAVQVFTAGKNLRGESKNKKAYRFLRN
jgi:pyruvate kinase